MALTPPSTATASASARAALAGNPSDGYGGATLAVSVRDFGAEVRAARASALAVEPRSELVEAAARRFGDQACALRWRSDVPREVGLGGSSAIVIATLRALAALNGAELRADELAAMALAVEAEDLAIAAGPQDRVVQAYEGLVFMDFELGTVERLDAASLGPLYLAWRVDAGAASGAVHADLRARHRAGDPTVRAGLTHLADHARAARDAVAANDLVSLAAAIDGSFDARRTFLELEPRLVRMVEIARAHGASANYAGSGGAIVGTLGEPESFAKLREALAAEGCEAIRPRVL